MSLRFGVAVQSLLLAIAFSLQSGAVRAQSPSGMLPAYDYDAQTPGVQPPRSPRVEGYDQRVFRTFQLSVPVFVPMSQLQDILPQGFTAIANPAGSATAQIGLGMTFHQRSERQRGERPTIDGPESTLAVTTTVRNDLLGRTETLILANEKSDAAAVASSNEILGDDTARLAVVETEISERNGMLQLRFEITDHDIGLSLRVRAEGPATLGTRTIQDPIATPLRSVSGRTASRAFWAAAQFDSSVVTVTTDNLRIHAPAHTLRLAGGHLEMVQVATTMTF